MNKLENLNPVQVSEMKKWWQDYGYFNQDLYTEFLEARHMEESINLILLNNNIHPNPKTPILSVHKPRINNPPFIRPFVPVLVLYWFISSLWCYMVQPNKPPLKRLKTP